MKRLIFGLAIGGCSWLAAGMLRAQPLNGNVTWSGAASGDNNWTTLGNWSSDAPPANPHTTGTVSFPAAADGQTSLLDPREWDGAAWGDPLNAWTINTFSRVTGTHTINLGGKTLRIFGNLTSTSPGGTLVVDGAAGSRLQIGQPGALRSIRDWAKLTVSPGVIFEAYLNEVNNNVHQTSTLDLSGAIIDGGVLRANSIILAQDGKILVDGDTDIDAIHAINRLEIGYFAGFHYIGDPDHPNQALPENVDIRFGLDAGTRTAVIIGNNHDSNRTPGPDGQRGKLVGSAGGDITGWIGTLNVATAGVASHGNLDASAMTRCELDVTTINIAHDPVAAATKSMKGYLRLPTGTVDVVTLNVGSDALGEGIVDLYGTWVSVSETVLVDKTGEINVYLDGLAGGLDLATAASLTPQRGGVVKVHFTTVQSVEDSEDVYWGIRWKGDKLNTLGGFQGSGAIQGLFDDEDAAFDGLRAAVFYDSDTDFTYFALVDDSVPSVPIASAHDLTIEMEPGGTVLVNLDEVDAGSFDPEGRDFTLSMTSGAQADVTQFTFTAYDDYPVALTISIDDSDPVIDATDNRTISIIEPRAGTAANLIWTGEADRFHMVRREWFWSDNWLGGLPPANPGGTLTFRDSGTSIVATPDGSPVTWTIGGLTLSLSPNHVIDLAGNTLVVNGNTSAGGTLTFVGAAGSRLQIGLPGTRRNITGEGMTLTLAAGMTLEAYVNEISSINAFTIDLRGVAIHDGVLSANRYELANGSRILLDGDTQIDALHVGNNTMRIGWYGALSYIGDEAHPDQALPEDLDLRFGVDAGTRATVTIGNTDGAWRPAGPGGQRGKLVASSGGQMTGWIGTLSVGTVDGGHGNLNTAAMDGCDLDITTLNVGTHANSYGYFRLPPGQAAAGTATVGATAGTKKGYVELNDTHFTVTGGLEIRHSGEVVVNVGGESSGILLADASTLAILDDGVLRLVFGQAPTQAGVHYGLKWEGDKTGILQPLLDAGRIELDISAIGGRAGTFVSQGYTYLGIPPPPGSLILLR